MILTTIIYGEPKKTTICCPLCERVYSLVKFRKGKYVRLGKLCKHLIVDNEDGVISVYIKSNIVITELEMKGGDK